MEEEFISGRRKARANWKRVAAKMIEKGYHVSSEECSARYRNMFSTYTRIKSNNKATGRGAVTWPYYTMFNEVYGQRGNIEPRSPLSQSMSNVENNISSRATLPHASTSQNAQEVSNESIFSHDTTCTENNNENIIFFKEKEGKQSWMQRFLLKKTEAQEKKDEEKLKIQKEIGEAMVGEMKKLNVTLALLVENINKPN